MDVLSRKRMFLVSDKGFGGGCGEKVGKARIKIFFKKKNQTYTGSTAF